MLSNFEGGFKKSELASGTARRNGEEVAEGKGRIKANENSGHWECLRMRPKIQTKIWRKGQRKYRPGGSSGS